MMPSPEAIESPRTTTESGDLLTVVSGNGHETLPQMIEVLSRAGALIKKVAPEEITLELAETLALLAPFGMGNPEPVFMLEGARVADLRVLKERHLKFRLEAGGQILEAIGFNMAEGREIPEMVTVAFSLQINEWNRRKSVQLRLRDFKPWETH